MYAHGKADFIAKLQIALKECSESEYWLELLIESGYYEDKRILEQCVEIKKLLISSINTAKNNLFTRAHPKKLSLRASAHTGVAIPRLKGTRYRLSPKIAETPILSGAFRNIPPLTGGLPRPLKRTGLAMTENFEAKPLNNKFFH